MSRIDYEQLIGKSFERLTILSIYKKGYIMFARCKCSCGNHKDIRVSALMNGNTKSCGCLRSEMVTENNMTHGDSKSRLYLCYVSMIYRCTKPYNKDYVNYGGRGISVCEEWSRYENFRDWALNNGYADNLTLDRIDYNGNYEPSNCRWITIQEQQNNKRTNVFLTHNGETMSLADWSRKLGIPSRLLENRKLRGKSVSEILSPVVKETERFIEYNGETHSMADWAKLFNMNYYKFTTRLRRRNFDLYDVVEHFGDMKYHSNNT